MAARDRRFARSLLRWQRVHGRIDLPWQGTRDPYRVWLSEIMLQQTRVSTVAGYYLRFLQRFPDVAALARAPLSRVLALWAGLGYYARARNLHACAREVLREHGGRFPGTAEELARLSGIGVSTAAAIAAFCFDERAAILDANAKRVIARFDAIAGDPARARVRAELERRARELLPPEREAMPAYTQAIMDLGATVCTRHRPDCARCPVAPNCRALAQGRTGELPERAPRAGRPVRRMHMLALLHGRAVLLERRQPRGIWGGLLSLPLFDTADESRRAAARRGARTLRTLGTRKHAFTHFTLHITPHIARLAGARPAGPQRGECWVALRSALRAGVPAPVRRLLEEIGASD